MGDIILARQKLEFSNDDMRRMLVLSMRGVERYRIANRFDVTPSKVTQVLESDKILKLRSRLCDKIDGLLFNEGEGTTNEQPS